jgi:hypothetical protein
MAAMSVDEFMALTRAQRYYLTHREELRKKASERYWADPEAAKASGKAYRERKKAERKAAAESKKSKCLTSAGENEQLHGSASALVSEKPGEAGGGKTCLCCPIHGNAS